MKFGIVCTDFFASTIALANALADNGDRSDIIIIDGIRRKCHNLEALEIYDKIQYCILKRIEKSKTRGIEHLDNHDRIGLFINKMPVKQQDGYKAIINLFIHFLRKNLVKRIIKINYDFVIVIGQDMFSAKLSHDLTIKGVKNAHTFHEIVNRFTDNQLYDSVRYIINKKIPIIVHSEYCKNELCRLTKSDNNSFYIPFGCFEGYKGFNTNERSILDYFNNDENFILAYGFIKEYKGYDLLYDAYLRIKRKGLLNFKIVIAGSGNLPILETIKDNKDFVIINKWVSNDETATLFDKCKAVVCPYKSVSQSGIPQTAFVYNKPVIATNVGAFPEIIINDNGKIVYSVESLADAIIEMMKSDIKVNIDDKYSWFCIKQEYLKLYNKL